jgi:hypothetical protein
LKRRLRWVLVACALFMAFAVVYAVQPSADARASNSQSSSVGGGRAAPPPPLARNDRFTVAEDKVLRVGGRGVLRNDRGAGLRALRTTNPKNGRLVLRRNGSLVYTPRANFHGRDSFVYRARDNRSRVNRGVATIIVRPVNDAPTISRIPAKTMNDTDGDTGAIPFTVSDVDNPPRTLRLSATSDNPGIAPTMPSASAARERTAPSKSPPSPECPARRT